MKRTMLGALIVMFFTVGAFAQLKLGYVNSDAILEQYSGTKAAEEELRKQYAQWEQEASRKEENIRRMQENLQKQALLLSEDRKMQIQREMQDSLAAYQKFLQDKFGQQGEATTNFCVRLWKKLTALSIKSRPMKITITFSTRKREWFSPKKVTI